MKTPLRVFLALLGAFIQAVGLCNIHAFANVTEGGVLGATLLLEHWLLISPALSALVLNILCYLFGWKTLGKEFLIYSAICSGAYSLFYALLAPYAPLWPGLVASPCGRHWWGRCSSAWARAWAFVPAALPAVMTPWPWPFPG